MIDFQLSESLSEDLCEVLGGLDRKQFFTIEGHASSMRGSSLNSVHRT